MFPKVESRMPEATTSLFSGKIGLKCHQMSVVDTVGWRSEQGLRLEWEVGSEAGSACMSYTRTHGSPTCSESSGTRGSNSMCPAFLIVQV